MKSLLLFLLLLVLAPPLPAQQPGVDQNSELLTVPPEDKFLRWHGHPGRTYFLQISIGSNPLVEWHWMPIIDFGTGVSISHEVGGTGPSGFYRLHYTDEPCPPGITLEDWDSDSDWLSNYEEISTYQTHPLLPDTDGDGLSDGEEVHWYASNPRSGDSDSDGLDDSQEILVYGTDPWGDDTDYDGVSDGVEVNELYSNPSAEDTDGDGMPDGWEVTYGLDLLDGWDAFADADSDGVPNGIEHDLRLNPQVVDTDADTIPDGDEDSDRDGLTNLQEISVHGTSPALWDHDKDGMPDGWEIANGLNAFVAAGEDGPTGDPDEDDLSNFDEWLNGTSADDANSDNDPKNDGEEVEQGSDPNDSADQGVAPLDKDIVEVPFTISDPSESESEKWRMIIKGKGPTDNRTMGLATIDFGTTASANLKLRKWNRYEVMIAHLTTDPDQPVENSGEPDYDWEATVDALPTTPSQEKTDDSPGVNNFFVAGKYWLVDNREVVFTKEKHGDEENIVDGKKAILVPIEIGDNLDSTGTDDLSLTSNDPNARGYQEDFWIMAPQGGPLFENHTHYMIHLSPQAPLEMNCANATPDPEIISLDDDEKLVSWRGTGSESADASINFSAGDPGDQVTLPIRVKSMRTRSVKVAVFPVRDPQSTRTVVPLPSHSDLVSKLTKAFGYQVNAWFDVDYKTQQEHEYDPDGDGYAIAEGTSGLGGLANDPDFNAPDADIRVFVIDNVYLRSTTSAVPGNMNYEIYGKMIGPSTVVINAGNPAEGLVSAEQVVGTIAHEIGHIMIGEGHPSDYNIELQFGGNHGGPAPLPGTDTSRRLMSSVDSRAPGAHLLVKTEWDLIEGWLKGNIDEDIP